MSFIGPELNVCFEATQAIGEPEIQPTLMHDYILPWAQSLPGSSILDVACGQGVEANFLQSQGFNVVGIDLSHELVSRGIHKPSIVGSSIALPFNQETKFAGVLIKDAWIFFSPNTRVQTLNELRKYLAPGGSILLVTELSERNRIYYLPNSSQIEQHETYPNDYNWEYYVGQLSKTAEITGIHFLTTTESTAAAAAKAWFNAEFLKEYRFDDPLACESRWTFHKVPMHPDIGKSGFIAKLTASAFAPQ